MNQIHQSTHIPKWLILTTLAYLLVRTSFAVEVTANIDNENPKVAEPFELTLTVVAPQGATVNLPAVPKQVGVFDVITHRDWADIPDGQQRRWVRHLQLESLQSGEQKIPPLSATVDGLMLQTETISLAVLSEIESPRGSEAFRDIKPWIEIPPPPVQESDWLWGSSILLVAIGLAAFALWQSRRRPELPHQWALRELEAMRTSETLRGKGAGGRISEAANLLREFVERQFSIPAPRQTTTEFLKRVQVDHRLVQTQRSLVKQFLDQVDEIKFSQREPDASQLDAAFATVEKFIHAATREATS